MELPLIKLKCVYLYFFCSSFTRLSYFDYKFLKEICKQKKNYKAIGKALIILITPVVIDSGTVTVNPIPIIH